MGRMRKSTEPDALRYAKTNAKRVARQLCYTFVDKDIIKKINDAQSEHEVTRLLITARHML